MYFPIISLSVLVLLLSGDVTLSSGEDYSNHFELEPGYDVYWRNNNDSDNKIIQFRIEFEKRWALFGIADCSRDLADVVTTWIDANASAHFYDQHMSNLSESRLSRDENPAGWRMLSSARDENKTQVEFEREIRLCDTTRQDLDIDLGRHADYVRHTSTY